MKLLFTFAAAMLFNTGVAQADLIQYSILSFNGSVQKSGFVSIGNSTLVNTATRRQGGRGYECSIDFKSLEEVVFSITLADGKKESTITTYENAVKEPQVITLLEHETRLRGEKHIVLRTGLCVFYTEWP